MCSIFRTITQKLFLLEEIFNEKNEGQTFRILRKTNHHLNAKSIFNI